MNVVVLIKAYMNKKNNRIINDRKRNRRIKNINDNNDVVVSDT